MSPLRAPFCTGFFCKFSACVIPAAAAAVGSCLRAMVQTQQPLRPTPERLPPLVVTDVGDCCVDRRGLQPASLVFLAQSRARGPRRLLEGWKPCRLCRSAGFGSSARTTTRSVRSSRGSLRYTLPWSFACGAGSRGAGTCGRPEALVPGGGGAGLVGGRTRVGDDPAFITRLFSA